MKTKLLLSAIAIAVITALGVVGGSEPAQAFMSAVLLIAIAWGVGYCRHRRKQGRLMTAYSYGEPVGEFEVSKSVGDDPRLGWVKGLGDWVFLFGAHGGKKLKDVPTHYLDWMLEPDTEFDDDVRQVVKTEKARRSL